MQIGALMKEGRNIQLLTDAGAQLQGTGTLRVNATSTLDATLSGTGTILYQGDPAVTLHNTGTGTVVQE